jgi:hypothetical protein
MNAKELMVDHDRPLLNGRRRKPDSPWPAREHQTFRGQEVDFNVIRQSANTFSFERIDDGPRFRAGQKCRLRREWQRRGRKP